MCYKNKYKYIYSKVLKYLTQYKMTKSSTFAL